MNRMASELLDRLRIKIKPTAEMRELSIANIQLAEIAKAIRGLALLYTGGRPISDLTDAYNFIGQGDVFGVPVPIIILVIMAIVTHVLHAHTKFGKYIYAIGGNEQAARVSGIDAFRGTK